MGYCYSRFKNQEHSFEIISFPTISNDKPTISTVTTQNNKINVTENKNGNLKEKPQHQSSLPQNLGKNQVKPKKEEIKKTTTKPIPIEELLNTQNSNYIAFATPKTPSTQTKLKPEDKINLKEIAQCFFEGVNCIRSEPFTFYKKIQDILNQIKLDENNAPYITFEKYNFTYKFRESLETLKKSEEFLTTLSPSDPRKLEDIRHNTFWIEKIYNNCQAHLNETNEDEKTFFDKVAKNYQYECLSFKIVFDGLTDGETMAILCLMDFVKERESIYYHSYDVGAAASIRTNDGNMLRTILLLVDIIYPGERERRFGQPVTKEEIPQSLVLTLDHPAFDFITYKNQIVDGDFSIEGNLIIAQFVLDSGETKNETIEI